MGTELMLMVSGYVLLAATLGAAAGLSGGLYLNSRYKRTDADDAAKYRALNTDTAQWRMPWWSEAGGYLRGLANAIADPSDPWEGTSPKQVFGATGPPSAPAPRHRPSLHERFRRLTSPVVTPTPLQLVQRFGTDWRRQARSATWWPQTGVTA